MDTYKIILAGTDQKNLKEIIDKIKIFLNPMPLEFEIVDDGKRLMNEIRFRKPIVIFAESGLPGFTNLQLQQEIQRQISDVPFFFLGFEKPSELSEGTLWIRIPIVNWENFKDQLVDSLPADIKMRFSIEKKDDQLLLELIEYGKRYRSEFKSASELRNQILMMPSFHPVQASSVRTHDLGTNPGKTKNKMEEIQGVFQIPIKWVYYEYALLCLSMVGSVFSFLNPVLAQSEQSRWIQGAFIIWTSLILMAVLANRKIMSDQKSIHEKNG